MSNSFEWIRADAVVGKLDNRGSADGGEPEAGRLRVILGGTLASAPLADQLATELVDLVEREQSEQIQPSPAGPKTPEVEISLRGLRLDREGEEALTNRLREHIRAHLAKTHDADVADSRRSEQAQ